MPAADSSRSRIVAAALDAFSRLGFDGASTREIALAARANQGLITYHFGSKEGLWQAAVDHCFAQLRASFAAPLEMLEEIDPATRLRLVLRQFVRFSASHPELHRLMIHEGNAASPRLAWLVERHVRPLFDANLALIRAAQSAGLFADIEPRHLHYILLGAATHIFTVADECRRLTGTDPCAPQDVDAFADALAAIFLGRTS